MSSPAQLLSQQQQRKAGLERQITALNAQLADCNKTIGILTPAVEAEAAAAKAAIAEHAAQAAKEEAAKAPDPVAAPVVSEPAPPVAVAEEK